MSLTKEQKEKVADWAWAEYGEPHNHSWDADHAVDMDENPIINVVQDRAWVQVWVLVPFHAAGVVIPQETPC